MKKLILTLSFLAVYILMFGQQGDGGTPKGLTYFQQSGIEIPIYSFEQPDIEKLRAEDEINDSLQTGPWRFGYNYTTSLDLFNSGTWSTTANGDKIWLMKITSEQARTINLTFSNTTIPEGNELYVYNPDKTFILGKFTDKHIYQGELGAELVPGNTVIVEYYVPSQNSNNIGSVEVSRVTHGYRTVEEYQTKSLGSSRPCNMNVNCPDGAPYKKQRNSAVMIVVGGSGICSGALINTTAFDGTPYVLSANHCGSNVTSWTFRFNWQSAVCNNPGGSPPFQSLSGAVLRSSRYPSDFSLMEIVGGLDSGTVPETHSPFFAGWDRGNDAPSSTFSIHHPRGDIKKISFDDNPAIAVQWQNSEPNGTWRVQWDRNTTTEGGSSGSPLFNSKGEIIGQLWGGGNGCGNVDFYGRIHNSWNPTGSSNADQLKHWLDPSNEGVTSIVGYDPYKPVPQFDATLSEVFGNESSECGPGFNPLVEIFNSGSTTLTSLIITFRYNGGSIETINWTGSLETYSSEIVQLPWVNNLNGANVIAVDVNKPNGQIDEDMSDNSFNLNYTAMTNRTSVDFKFYLGCFSQETSWILKDNGGTTLYSGSNYPGSANWNYLVEEEFCLLDGCYKLILNDTHGDGVAGSSNPNCNYDGNMTLRERLGGQIFATLPESQANFGYTRTFDFCIVNASVSVNELEDKVTVFPNPSKGVFNITMDFQGEKEVTLTSITGKIVGTYRVSENHLQVDESHLSAGVYMLTISNENNRITRKLIVE